MSPNRPRSFLSQFILMINVIVLLITFSPCVTSSPTRLSDSVRQGNNRNFHDQMIHQSNDFLFDSSSSPSNDERSSSVFSSSSVRREPDSDLPLSLWYGQPRSHANQFLLSSINDNDLVVPKSFTRFNFNGMDDDNQDDEDLSNLLQRKRSLFIQPGQYSNVKKRKQMLKPPMEVMNEIVNSIYLKR